MNDRQEIYAFLLCQLLFENVFTYDPSFALKLVFHVPIDWFTFCGNHLSQRISTSKFIGPVLVDSKLMQYFALQMSVFYHHIV